MCTQHNVRLQNQNRCIAEIKTLSVFQFQHIQMIQHCSTVDELGHCPGGRLRLPFRKLSRPPDSKEASRLWKSSPGKANTERENRKIWCCWIQNLWRVSKGRGMYEYDNITWLNLASFPTEIAASNSGEKANLPDFKRLWGEYQDSHHMEEVLEITHEGFSWASRKTTDGSIWGSCVLATSLPPSNHLPSQTCIGGQPAHAFYLFFFSWLFHATTFLRQTLMYQKRSTFCPSLDTLQHQLFANKILLPQLWQLK